MSLRAGAAAKIQVMPRQQLCRSDARSAGRIPGCAKTRRKASMSMSLALNVVGFAR